MNAFDGSITLIVTLISAFISREVAFSVAYSIIGFSFLLLIIGILPRHIHFRQAMRRAIRRISAENSDPAHTSEGKIGAVDAELRTNNVLQDAWLPYYASLRVDPWRPEARVNTLDPHSWFALERLPGRGYEKWASTMAGVSLTVGLLFTFVGLTAALLKVGDAGADTAELRLAIAEILQISSAKFITSMAGIVTYILWTVLARQFSSTQAKLASTFASKIQTLTRPVSPEAILFDTFEEAQQQTTRLKTLSDDIAIAFDRSLTTVVGQRLDSLPHAVGELLQPALEKSMHPVVQAIEQMGSTIGQSSNTALEGMISNLLSGVNDATGREMSHVVAALRDAANELTTAKSGIGDSGEEFHQALSRAADAITLSSARMAEAMENRAGNIDTRMHRIEEAFSAGAHHLDAMGNSMSERLADGLQHAMQAIAEAASSGAAVAREHTQAELAPVLYELKGLIQDIRASADDSRGALVEGGRSAASDLSAALSRVSDELTGASVRASSVLVDAFQGSTSRMLTSVEASVSGYQQATEALANRLSAVEQGFRVLDQAVRVNVGHLGDAGATVSAAGRTLGTASDQLRLVAEPIVSTLRTVEDATSSARDVLQSVQASEGAAREAALKMGEASSAANRVFDQHRLHLTATETALNAAYGRLRERIVEIGERSVNFMNGYDDHLSKGLGALLLGVQNLREAIEMLGDTMRPAT